MSNHRPVEWLSWGSLMVLMVATPATADPPVGGAPAAAPSAQWPMFRGNEQLTGVAVGRLPDRLAVRWKFETQEPFSSSAAVVDDTVYVGCDDGRLYALDLRQGKPKWQYEAEGPVQSSPLVFDRTVFFGDDEGVMHAVDTRTGKRRWTFRTDGPIIPSANRAGGRI
ncbi:MAG: PQQ-like beta-propeller repeat protein, partial [Planctomycetes bacterium]|nr:PQQ-like beta-propeller repeat protein [Planctomycetota bacterium]